MTFRPALLVIDVQNDFCAPKGANRVVGDGMALVPPIRELLSLPGFAIRAASLCECHEENKAMAHVHKDTKPFEHHVDLPNPKKGHGHRTVKHQALPMCCIEGTWGAKMVEGLSEEDFDFVIRRNKHPDVFMFSALKDLHGNEKHDVHPEAVSHHLGDELSSRNITHVFCLGTAGDYCVSHTAMDLVDAGFAAYVVEDLTLSFDVEKAWPTMKKELHKRGVEVIKKDGPELGKVRAIGGKVGGVAEGKASMVFQGNFMGPVFFGYSAEQAKGLM